MKRGALLLAAALLLLRIAFLGATDLFPEEAYYWNYAMHLDIGYLDHPPMIAWLIHAGTSLLGNGEAGVRIGTLACALITAFFIFRLTRLLFDARAAWTAVLLVQVLPFYFLIGFMMTPDAPLTACWAGALYFLARALLRGETAGWLGLGVCLGLGMLSKYTIVLLGPATLLFITMDQPSRRWWRHPAPFAAVALALAIFSPVIVWNARHHWASFAFQGAKRMGEDPRFSTHELLAAMLVVLTPVGIALAWQALRGRASASVDEARRIRFARIYTLVPLAVFLVFSFTHRVKLNWTGPLWLAVIPAVAAGLVGASPVIRRFWMATLAVLSLFYAGFLTHLAFGLPWLGYPEDMALFPVGWREMARALEAERTAIPPPANGRVLLVGMDRNFIASEAAYYHSRQRDAVRDTTGAHLFRGISLMYSYWFPVEELRGSTLLLVTFNRPDLDVRRVREHSGMLSDIEEHWIERDGKRIRPYYTRVAGNYQPTR